MSCGLYKDHNFHKIISKRFVSDVMHNGMNADIKDSKEKTRRYIYERDEWIGNPQYGRFSLMLGFNRKHR